MTAQTFSKPVVTIPRQPRPPAPRWEGLFLEPALPPMSEENDLEEESADADF